MFDTVLKTTIDTRWIGPFYFAQMHYLNRTASAKSFHAPLATYETPLFASVSRGARVIEMARTLETTLLSDAMTRSILFEAPSAKAAKEVADFAVANLALLQKEVVEKTSRYAQLKKIDAHFVGSLVYLRLGYFTDNASGHNMATLASDQIGQWLWVKFPSLKYISVSGNVCTDKKVSSVNAIQGRGKHIIAELRIPRTIVASELRSTPEKIVDLNTKKNLLGSILAGSIHSANAHFANMLLALYLATGQDAANIVEGSQGITYAEVQGDSLYFSVSLPNLILGTVGNGKTGNEAEKNLEAMGCIGEQSAQTLAHIAAAVVLAGELSLLAALTNQNELVNSHLAIERKRKK